nr:hypothetical protein [Akkermansia sp.]
MMRRRGSAARRKEQEEFHIRVVKLEGGTHSGMEGGGTEKQHELSKQFVLEFIK